MEAEASKPRVEPVQTEDDVTRCHHCAVEAFARQAEDGIWCAFNPGWDTPEGEARGARRLVARWRASQAEGPGACDAQGRAHTIILKAVLPREEGRSETVAGVAIWMQVSFVAGHGFPAPEDWGAAGLARALVQWGLDEAQRRGGIECITEASSMGRKVYLQMGFRQEGGEMAYLVDDEFKDRKLPSNVFLRTRPPGQ
ncbi:hypothetical protein MAPG_09802 [Magnaporthiopsis poae ATCC 64411]|uniref:N-acetyltransferase domain-containing protein n=1 Tax=Magnaporthiopsis poae (strain ATCC 64411 / 73-15) TaxID=644358 RepID=A0A0C4EAW6_MAGP6|nr:hypothetical protein MAPG_09802 [Magnaporthiopsis poae ATCC 64411]